MFEEALAAPLDIEIIARSAWNAGYTLVAEKFQRGRIFLGGDAVHLFTPAGGLGYNTAVEDAVNLGWKLNAVLNGWGGAALLDTYETERQAIAGATPHTPAALPTRSGCSCRRRSWRTKVRPARRRESYRRPFQSSRPIRVQHSGHHLRRPLRRLADHRTGRHGAAARCAQQLPADRLPGRPRAASVARRGRSLYERSASSSRCWRSAQSPPMPRRSAPLPRRMSMPLTVVPIASDEARDLYGADLALIRPDQIVAWRGNSSAEASAVLRRAAGHSLTIDVA